MDITPHTVIGMTEGMHAARAEARRIMDANKGNPVADQKAVLARLTDAELITGDEADTLLRLYKIAYAAGEPKGDPTRAYFESRDIYDCLAASGKTTPIALLVAGATLGAFDVTPTNGGSPTVVVYKQSYGPALAGIGAGIGAIIGGAAGGVLGGQIGGFIGGIIDEKKDKPK
jgi:hypothetical protein